MRIAGDPLTLVRVAQLLAAERDVLETELTGVGNFPLPDMPVWLRQTLEAELQETALEARRSAVEADNRSRDLARRAWFLFTAGGGRTAFELADRLHGLYGDASMILREARFMSAYSELERMSSGVLSEFGPDSLEAANAWFRWQSELPASMLRNGTYLHLAEGDWYGARYAAAGPGWLSDAWAARLGFASKWAGRVSGPLMIFGSVETMIHGSPYGGVRGGIDRWVAPGAGIGAGAVFTLAAAGVAIAPPVLIAAGVVSLGVGAWALGNLIYDHRAEIGHAIAGGSEWVWHHSLPGMLYDHRAEIGHAVAQVSQWGHDTTEKAVNWATNTVSSVTQKAGDMLGSATHSFTSALGSIL